MPIPVSYTSQRSHTLFSCDRLFSSVSSSAKYSFNYEFADLEIFMLRKIMEYKVLTSLRVQKGVFSQSCCRKRRIILFNNLMVFSSRARIFFRFFRNYLKVYPNFSFMRKLDCIAIIFYHMK